VIIPLIRQKETEKGMTIPLTPDTRKKPDKFYRIEGTLDPVHRKGNLIFNIKEQKNPHMERMEQQMLGVSATSKMMDGPDLLEGGVWLIQNSIATSNNTYAVGFRTSQKY